MKYPLIIVLFYPGILQEARSRANTRAGVSTGAAFHAWGPRPIQDQAFGLKNTARRDPVNSPGNPGTLLLRLAAESRLAVTLESERR
jgi:hypothetical protein